MSFAAHGADAIDLAGGTLAKYVGRGHEIVMVVLSQGAKSHAMKNTDLEELRCLKEQELNQACKRLGVQHLVCLNYEEDPLIFGRKELTDVVNLIRGHRPDVVMTHHLSGDFVPDHCETGKLIWRACHCAGRPGFDSSYPVHIVRNIFTYGLMVSQRGQLLIGSPAALPDVYIDVSDTIEQKIESMVQFQSQEYSLQFMKRRMEAIEGHYGLELGVRYAEPFYTLKPFVLDELPLYNGVDNYGRKVEGTQPQVG